MNWCSSRFAEPTAAPGDWTDRRETRFWSDDDPLVVRVAIEKMTTTLLTRDEEPRRLLSYVGFTSASGSPRTVRLSLADALDGRRLYDFVIERTTPRRWISQARFAAECERSFASWCAKLHRAPGAVDAAIAPSAEARAIADRSVALEDAAGRVVEDPGPVVAVQREVIDRLRAGWGFFDAHKEGGTHLSFDGSVFVRADYGEEPNLRQTYETEAGMLEALRRFHDWESRRDTYPHRPPEVDVWRYILAKMMKSDG